MDRTQRQKESIKKWLSFNGKATIVAATGVGKTRIALMTISLLNKKHNLNVLIVVPTHVLKTQWELQLHDWKLDNFCTVEVINTIITQNICCDFLVLDECHLYASTTFQKVFNCVSYNFIMCLTATIERLDGKEIIIKKYAPVCDNIPIDVAISCGWVSPVKKYLVLLDVDLTEYKNIDRKFNAYFSIFGWDYNIAMKCLQDWKFRNHFSKLTNISNKDLIAASADWMRCLQKRKQFIASHPKKLEVCKKILSARKNSKCIVFASTIKDAEQLNCDYVLHSKIKKSENNETLKQFNECKTGSIASSKALNTGVDIKGLSVGIVMNVNSSKIKTVQEIGRVCRFEKNKVAEMFTLVLKGTQEFKWFQNSNTSDVIVINEEQLTDVLNNKELITRQRDLNEDVEYRF